MNRLLFIVVIASVAARCGKEQFDHAREVMVQTQIVARGIIDTATLRAMRTVPRHEFVTAERRGDAYSDFPVPIGYGQTISQPYIVAVMTEMVKPGKGQHVLEIGTGSGYGAAVLAEIVDSVYTVEIIPELAASSTDRLRRLGFGNVVVRQGNGYQGWPEHAPFDAIVVTAAADSIPPALVEQLRSGGRMVIPVGPVESVQALTLVEKHGSDVITKSMLPVRFVPLVGGR